MTFKVGDRVRRIDCEGCRGSVFGQTGIIVRQAYCYPDTCNYVRLDHNNGETYGIDCRFELIDKYAPDDILRVTYEGRVGHGPGLYRDNLSCAKTIEVIEKAKPEWAERVGAVVLDSYDMAWRFGSHQYRWLPASIDAPDFRLSYAELVDRSGPLTLLHDPATDNRKVNA